jgi:hypothetical protein
LTAYVVTIQNTAPNSGDPNKIASAKVTVPTGFAISSVSTSNSWLVVNNGISNGNVVMVQANSTNNSNTNTIAGGSYNSMTITINATATTASTTTWAVAAYSNNNFTEALSLTQTPLATHLGLFPLQIRHQPLPHHFWGCRRHVLFH